MKSKIFTLISHRLTEYAFAGSSFVAGSCLAQDNYKFALGAAAAAIGLGFVAQGQCIVTEKSSEKEILKFPTRLDPRTQVRMKVVLGGAFISFALGIFTPALVSSINTPKSANLPATTPSR